jgi:hypothetical protein
MHAIKGADNYKPRARKLEGEGEKRKTELLPWAWVLKQSHPHDLTRFQYDYCIVLYIKDKELAGGCY